MRGLLLLPLVLLSGCAHPMAGRLVVGMLAKDAWMYIVCPDKLPPLILQDVTCPQACGFSCLPGRWSVERSPE